MGTRIVTAWKHGIIRVSICLLCQNIHDQRIGTLLPLNHLTDNVLWSSAPKHPEPISSRQWQ